MFIAVLYPYVYLLARTAFLERPTSLIEAGRTMGLDARRAFWRIDLPLARPAIAGGIALALMETLADYGTVAYFAVDTFTTGIYRAWFALGDKVAAAQLSAALLAFVVAAVLLERWSRGAARTAGVNRMRSPQAPGATAARRLARRARDADLRSADRDRFRASGRHFLRGSWGRSPDCPAPRASASSRGTAFRVAGTSAILAVLLAIVIAYAVRLSPMRSPAARAGSFGSVTRRRNGATRRCFDTPSARWMPPFAAFVAARMGREDGPAADRDRRGA
jgi:iron(III) transport system permease protein